MSSVYVRIGGDREKLLKRMEKLARLRKAEAGRAMAEALRTAAVERFGTQKSPEGKRWKTSIRAKAEGGKTLTKTAYLKNSIRSEADEKGFAVGTNVIYAATHQLGDTGRTIRPRKAKALRFQVNGKWVSAKQVTVSIPARPFLGISEEDEAELAGIIDDMMGEE